MRVSPNGWSQEDFISVLEHYGFQLVRHVRHGAMLRHEILARHPDREVRVSMAQVVIPKGRSLRDYVAVEVVTRVDFLLAYLDNEQTDAAENS